MKNSGPKDIIATATSWCKVKRWARAKVTLSPWSKLLMNMELILQELPAPWQETASMMPISQLKMPTQPLCSCQPCKCSWSRLIPSKKPIEWEFHSMSTLLISMISLKTRCRIKFVKFKKPTKRWSTETLLNTACTISAAWKIFTSSTVISINRESILSKDTSTYSSSSCTRSALTSVRLPIWTISCPLWKTQSSSLICWAIAASPNRKDKSTTVS